MEIDPAWCSTALSGFLSVCAVSPVREYRISHLEGRISREGAGGRKKGNGENKIGRNHNIEVRKKEMERKLEK